MRGLNLTLRKDFELVTLPVERMSLVKLEISLENVYCMGEHTSIYVGLLRYDMKYDGTLN